MRHARAQEDEGIVPDEFFQSIPDHKILNTEWVLQARAPALEEPPWPFHWRNTGRFSTRVHIFQTLTSQRTYFSCCVIPATRRCPCLMTALSLNLCAVSCHVSRSSIFPLFLRRAQTLHPTWNILFRIHIYNDDDCFFFTIKSSLVPLIEGLCAQIYFRFEISVVCSHLLLFFIYTDTTNAVAIMTHVNTQPDLLFSDFAVKVVTSSFCSSDLLINSSVPLLSQHNPQMHLQGMWGWVNRSLKHAYPPLKNPQFAAPLPTPSTICQLNQHPLHAALHVKQENCLLFSQGVFLHDSVDPLSNASNEHVSVSASWSTPQSCQEYQHPPNKTAQRVQYWSCRRHHPARNGPQNRVPTGRISTLDLIIHD